MWSIIALVATIVVGGIMLGTAALYGTRAFTGSGLETAITETADMAQNLKGVYGATINGAGSFSSVSNAEGIRAGAVPSSMLTGDGQTITGPWRNPVFLGGSGDGNTLYIDWTQVPSTVCAKFAVSQSVNGVFVNGTWVPSSNSGFASQVTQLCNQGAGSASELKFSYVMNYN